MQQVNRKSSQIYKSLAALRASPAWPIQQQKILWNFFVEYDLFFV